MKKNIRVCTLFSVVFTMLSCTGQQKTKPKHDSTPPLKKERVNLEEIDPYFVEVQAIESSYGPLSITRNILEDKSGTIWLATWEGIIKFDGKTFTNITKKERLRPFHVFSLMEDTKGNIWFGTIGAGLYRYDGKSFTNFTTEDGLVNDSIGCIMEAKNGAIWIGTMNGISKYDGTSFTNFGSKEGMTNTDVNDITEDNSGKLWIGTRGAACIYDGKTFTRIITPKGKTFTNVRSILRDKEGVLWLGGNDGLWSYKDNNFTNYAKGFTGYIYQDRKENIWTSSATNGYSPNWILSKYDKRSRATPFQIRAEKNMFFGITEDTKGNIWLGTLRGVYRYDGSTFNDFKAPEISFE